MNRQELIKEFKTLNGSLFITRNELAKAMSYNDPHCVDRFLYGLERVGKKYFIPDVVSALKRESRVAR